MKTALIIYEPGQLASLDTLLLAQGEGVIVSLDAEIDYALEKRGIPFISGKTLQNRTEPTFYMRADEIVRTICDSQSLSFLEYRGISLLKPVRLSIHVYVIELLHYIELITRFLDTRNDIKHVAVPEPLTPVSATSGFLAAHEVYVVVEAARRVAEARNISFEIIRNEITILRVGAKLQRYFSAFKRALFGASMSLLNVLVGLRPSRPVRILASDYWRNISPILRQLPEAELILLDRSEALKAGFANIWRHKMRFVHIQHFLSRRARSAAYESAKDYMNTWKSIRSQAWSPDKLLFYGVQLAPLFERIMSRIIEHALPRVLCDIEGTYAMYKSIVPSTVLLRASVSGQTHFAILPLVAQQMQIPALELQHGLQYVGPGAPTVDHPAEYIATYGPVVNEEFVGVGYPGRRLIAAGSPRFDSYIADANTLIESAAKSSKVSFLSIAPPVSMGEGYRTYFTEEYFSVLGKVIREVPRAHLIVSLRSARQRKGLSEEAEERGLAGVAREDLTGLPLNALFARADIVLCNYTTVIYEAMLYYKPVIVVALTPVERMMADFHFSRFVQAGAVAVAHNPEELVEVSKKLALDASERERMSAAAAEFLKNNFSFDGKSSQRIAQQIRTWAHSISYATH